MPSLATDSQFRDQARRASGPRRNDAAVRQHVPPVLGHASQNGRSKTGHGACSATSLLGSCFVVGPSSRAALLLYMLSIISLVVVVILSMLVVRIATVASTLTGLSGELVRFKARSVFTGAGFTRGKSEKVVGHPVRRRINMLLMLLGNVGIITAMSTSILSAIDTQQAEGIYGTLWFSVAALFAGLL